MQTLLQTHAPELARFLDNTPHDAGVILVRAAALASKSEPDAPDLQCRALSAAAALFDTRCIRGEALEFAEATAAEFLARAPKAWTAAHGCRA